MPYSQEKEIMFANHRKNVIVQGTFWEDHLSLSGQKQEP